MSILQVTDTPVLLNSYRSIDPKRIVTKRISTSGVVYSNPCWLYWMKVYCPKVTQWLVPDEGQDPDNRWFGEHFTVDENLVTGSVCFIDALSLTEFLVLKSDSSVFYNGIAINCLHTGQLYANVRFYYDEGGVLTYDSSKNCLELAWETMVFSKPVYSDMAAVKIYNSTGLDAQLMHIYELRFIIILPTQLELRDNYTKVGLPKVELSPKWEDVEHIVFNEPIKFNKALYATLKPAGSYAEFGFVPIQ